LTVYYEVSGTATNGQDFATLSGKLVISAEAAYAILPLTPRDDLLIEGKETVTVRLLAPADYLLGEHKKATVPIADNEESLAASLVAPGATWKYLDDGSNQGTAWRSRSFDDSAWQQGRAQLGYGDGDEKTILSFGPDPLHKYITTYFRISFNVTDPSDFDSLILRLLRDDGAVVYLNGVEVFRSNMPDGTITYTTLASASTDDEEDTFYATTLDPLLLVSGRNVLTVEVHQRGPDSSDLSFDLQLLGVLA
jgi:hypothetical protein